MKRKTLLAGVAVVSLVAIAVWWKLRDDNAASPATSGGAPGGIATAASHAAKDRASAPLASISGRVTSKAGGGIASAIVTVNSAGLEVPGRAERRPIVATTDANGAWSAQLTSGSYVVSAHAAGFVPTRHVGRVAVAPGEKRVGIDLVLEEGGTLVTGTVSDVTGGPIDGARVAFERGAAFGPGETVAFVATTTADGKFRISLANGGYQATASHDEYTRSQRELQVAGKSPVGGDAASSRMNAEREALIVDFVLTPGGVIRGRVVSRGDGKPLARAHVRGSARGSGARTANTDAAGVFTLRGVPPGAVSLTAYARGHASSAPTVVDLGIGEQVDDVVIFVDAAFSISGRVIEKGKPGKGIPGVVVGGFSFTASAHVEALEPSAEDGSYEIVGVRPLSYVLYVLGEGFMPEIGKSVEVVDRDVTRVDVELSVGVTISGRVEPPAVATIGLELGGNVGLATIFESMKAMGVRGESDATGAFTLKTVPNGTFSIHATTPDGRAGKLPITIADQDQRGLVVKLEPRASIAGRVVDTRGGAVASVRVSVTATEDPAAAMLRMTPKADDGAISAADGSFRVLGLDGGKVTISVRDDQGPLAWADAAHRDAPNTPIALELVKGVEKSGVTLTVEARDGVIRGLVLGSDGKPAADAWVTASVIRDKSTEDDIQAFVDEARGRSMRPVLTGPDGKFMIDRLSRANYKLVVQGDRGRSRGEKSNVKAGETVTITLTSLGTLSGRVTLGNAPVTTFDIDCKLRKFRGTHRRITNADGAYTLERLVPGKYECEIDSDAGTAKATIEVPGGVAKLDFALAPWATLTGTVVDALSGEPVAGVHVVVEGMGPRTMETMMIGEGTTASGKFSVESVAPGSGKLTVIGTKGFESLALREYTATAGQRVDLGTIKIVRPRTGDLGTYGLTTKTDAGTLEVSFVKQGGPAEAAGIKVGDQIISIDGRPVRELGVEIASRILSSGTISSGQSVLLGLARGAQVKLVAVASA